MRNGLFILFFAILLGSCSRPAEIYVSGDNKAIHGYDPVAYFKEGRPAKGSDDFQYEWKGATWNFTKEENLADFKSDPEKFAPQYGGYCAFGMSNGYKAETQPDAWSIVDGKLYLNYNTGVREEWFPEKEKLIEKANGNWPSVKESSFGD